MRPTPTAGTPSPSPEGVLAALTESAAEGLMNWYKAFRGFRQDHPDTPHLAETDLALRVAALALIEALDKQHGRVPITEMPENKLEAA